MNMKLVAMFIIAAASVPIGMVYAENFEEFCATKSGGDESAADYICQWNIEEMYLDVILLQQQITSLTQEVNSMSEEIGYIDEAFVDINKNKVAIMHLQNTQFVKESYITQYNAETDYPTNNGSQTITIACENDSLLIDDVQIKYSKGIKQIYVDSYSPDYTTVNIGMYGADSSSFFKIKMTCEGMTTP